MQSLRVPSPRNENAVDFRLFLEGVIHLLNQIRIDSLFFHARSNPQNHCIVIPNWPKML